MLASKRNGPPVTPCMAPTTSCVTVSRPGGMHYLLAVPKHHAVIRPSPGTLGVESRADAVMAALDARAWRTRTAGAGTTGDRQATDQRRHY